ncbi:tetratricopeptide repeat protein [Streptomyces sp. NPDC101116]|uniref:tetratricopeptide repeat protein n=1 Tax=Streptomyces sp. NPDC101116 TaxID=3366107 RepID=UPI00380FE01C
MGRGDEHAAGGAVDAQVAATETGNAAAVSGAAAVTGYRGPAPETNTAPTVTVRVSSTGGATASEGGLANTGYIHEVSAGKLTVVQQLARHEPALWPHQVGVIPSRAQSFQHRIESGRLRMAVDDSATVVLSQVPAPAFLPAQVLTGMGGVGKTQLAADYARTAWAEGRLDILVWITASGRTPVVTGYAQAGYELCRADPDDPEQAAQTFLAWLTPKAGQRPCRWLVILDDVSDPDDLRGLWPPASSDGHTLVTTRRRDAVLGGEGRRMIEVGLFTEAEALAYLTASLSAHSRCESADQLTALVRDLGYLPLALAQAAAYLIDSGENAGDYRALLADRTTTLADTTPDRLPDDQALPLAAAWSLSLDRADTLRPAGLARPMLHLAALLDANGIPQGVLTSQPALDHLARQRVGAGNNPTGEPVTVSVRDAVGALRALHRLSLVDHIPDVSHPAVRVHQLIQRATRDTFSADQRDQFARTAGDALMAAWSDPERGNASSQALRVNTTALMTCALHALHEPDLHPILFRAGDSLGEAGQVIAAINHYRSLLGTTAHVLGDSHAATLAVRHSLSRWQGDAGDVSGAAHGAAKLLADRLKVLGPDHPDTLATRHNLAHWQGQSGETVGAAAAFAELLKDRLRVLGPDHLHTLNTRSALAHWQAQAGDAVGAAAATAELLKDCMRILGPHHPQSLAARNSLARWRGEAGDVAGAARATADLLQDRLRILGPDHPHTLSTRSGLARWQGQAGNITGAVTATSEVLEDCLRVLGPLHPLTIITRAHLARWRGEAGDSTGAVNELAEVLQDSLRVLGPHHQHTRFIRTTLAHWQARES